MVEDIRWKQRFSNFKKGYELLKEAAEIEEYSQLETEGMIQRFEYTYELAWLTLKDYLEDQGYSNITGSKDAIKAAFSVGLITDAELWLEMVTSRKLSSHTYNEETAIQIAKKIREEYCGIFSELITRLQKETGS
jgi:nucleotidyltransferase substrate binding protein (TIGR01987 family)